MEDIQYCGGYLVLWRISSTEKGNHDYFGRNNLSVCSFPLTLNIFHCSEYPPQYKVVSLRIEHPPQYRWHLSQY